MVVVLPLPLTPITRITCGRGKAVISSGLATGRRIAAISSATASFSSRSVIVRPKRFSASLARMRAAALRAEVGHDQRVLDIVERGIVQLRRADDPGEVLGEAFRRLAEAAEQALGSSSARSLQQAFLSCDCGVTVRWCRARCPAGRATRAKLAA